MRLVTLNLQTPSAKRLAGILTYLQGLSPALMVLTELKWTATMEAFCGNLHDYFVEVSNRDGDYAVVIASKWPLRVVDAQRRLLEVSVPEIDLRVVGAYVPCLDPAKPERKAEHTGFWDLLRDRAETLRDVPAIITGDLNSCLAEDSHNGTPWSADRVRELHQYGWQDAWSQFRDGSDTNRFTWYSRTGGLRLDYAFLSPGILHRVQGTRAHHDQSSRERKVSNHASLVVDFPS